MVIVSYGQSRNFVEYLIETYGPEKIAETIASIAEGRSGDIAIRNVYGKTVQQLDNEWRAKIGADPYVPPTPTPTPEDESTETSEYKLLTLTPVKGGISVGETGSEPTPEPTNTPTPIPTAEPTAETEVMVKPTATEESQPEPAQKDDGPEEESASSSGPCNSNGNGPLEASPFLVTLLMAGLYLSRRIRR